MILAPYTMPCMWRSERGKHNQVFFTSAFFPFILLYCKLYNILLPTVGYKCSFYQMVQKTPSTMYILQRFTPEASMVVHNVGLQLWTHMKLSGRTYSNPGLGEAELSCKEEFVSIILWYFWTHKLDSSQKNFWVWNILTADEACILDCKNSHGQQ